MKIKLVCIVSALALLTSCAPGGGTSSTATPDISQETLPTSSSSGSTSAPSEEELAEQSAIDCLSAYYSGEDIYSTSIH